MHEIFWFINIFYWEQLNYRTMLTDYAGGPAYYVLHPEKGITICIFFFNLPVLQKPGRNRSRFGKKSGAGAGATWKKSGVGAAKKFAGSPALLKTYYQIVMKMKLHHTFKNASKFQFKDHSYLCVFPLKSVQS